MKYLLITAVLIFSFSAGASAQTECPQGRVCFTQAEANEIFAKLSELVSAKDLIIKMTAERGTAEAALAQMQRVLTLRDQYDSVNDRIILKQKEMFALYDQVITMYQKLVGDLEQRLMKKKSTWDKIAGVLQRIGDILIGAAVGSVLR